MKTIEISKANYYQYSNVKEVMDELVIFDKNTGDIRMSYQTFAEKVNEIINKQIKNPSKSKLTFKEYVADVKDNDNTIDIDYQLYEEFIKASLTIKIIKDVNKIKMDGWSWDDYGATVSSIIQTYNKK